MIIDCARVVDRVEVGGLVPARYGGGEVCRYGVAADSSSSSTDIDIDQAETTTACSYPWPFRYL